MSTSATFVANSATSNFGVLLTSPALQRQMLISVRPIPGTNTAYVDNGGQQPATFRARLHFADFANWNTFQGQVGYSGTLTYSEATYTSAYLVSADHAGATGRGDQFADATWQLNS